MKSMEDHLAYCFVCETLLRRYGNKSIQWCTVTVFIKTKASYQALKVSSCCRWLWEIAELAMCSGAALEIYLRGRNWGQEFLRDDNVYMQTCICTETHAINVLHLRFHKKQFILRIFFKIVAPLSFPILPLSGVISCSEHSQTMEIWARKFQIGSNSSFNLFGVAKLSFKVAFTTLCHPSICMQYNQDGH